jgi:predicted RNA binding protein YcfA (HicA-like mRNA interferase family)
MFVSRLTPCKRRDFIKKLGKLGFENPKSGTRHQFMVYQQYRLTIPSNSEYSVPQLRMMIREVETIIARQINIDDWNEL